MKKLNGPWHWADGILINSKGNKIDLLNSPEAKLIAAAPEMLEALLAVNKLVTQMMPSGRFMGERNKKKWTQIENMEKSVFDALTKALG